MLMEPGYSIENGVRVYAIGDVHGCVAALDAMHALIDEDISTFPVERPCVVYLGDFVDRGPDSAGVVERLVQRSHRRDGIRRYFLKGNHEAAMLAFPKDPVFVEWLRYGGIQTLESYGIGVENRLAPLPSELERLGQRLTDSVPTSHLRFLSALETSVTIGGYLFVHAGIRPGVPLAAQEERDLIEIREPFLSCEDLHEWRVVYGHSAYDEPFVRPNRIGIDTRCVFGGKLSCLVAEGRGIRFLSVSPHGERLEE
ncbi:MAG: serine/threonine protein phosphatase [Alphaproteobacteria bacterium]|nr:serine/threonine protein phosphatase [Alphaproteobacteria bacterium]